MSSSSTSHGYFDSVSTQLSLSVGSSFEGVAGNSSANASQGISAGVSAVDTGMKAGMALAGAFDAGMESAYVPALAGLGLKGMACLPISKQLDPVLGIDCHIMIPGGPLPNPYIGLLINPADFITVAIAFVLSLPAPPMPEEGGGGDADGAKMAGIAHTVATIVIGMMGATVKIGNFILRAVAGTFTRNIFHFPIGGAFALPPMNKGHAFMGSLNVLADGDPLSGGGAHLHMDCWDIGIPTPHIIKKDKEYFALFMPTGIIIPIPWSRPVLTNPVPIPLTHELMRHKYLQDKGLAGINRLSGNPSIALDAIHHRLKPQVVTQGGAHYHETQIRRNMGLRSNQFHPSHKRELDIVQGALRKVGIPASVARRLRKEADMFCGNLLKQEKKSTYK